ncbi:prepilin-type N-terminal cleavage/methylation domain-containing protein [Alteromonas aestuariivivens]|uniref:Type II secretion system protein H n=1 Tax=Alteromonas aestuariivivens TaxID=1938339 RepID=A0A3D8MFC2_9ALTE|nr:GspH/FimT family pseudopilin [Alteromonas aestuariivivens]RDV29326.1 prepilin-type N-terminal cleavage/methylation domain-containing protein [Alteromonas aestuariivivens]
MAQRGLTLMELMITLALTAILLMTAIPSYTDYQRKQALRGSLSQLYFLFRKAQNLALAHQKPVYAVIQTQNSWCIGLTEEPDCDCRVERHCQVEGESWQVSAPAPMRVTLDSLTFANHRTRFDPVHGRAYGYAGTLILSDGQRKGKIVINNLGRVRMCMSQGLLGGYPSCDA